MLSLIAHTDHPVAGPLADESVDSLLRRVRLPRAARILDLGCGQAAWLIRALAMHPDASAEGVDVSRPALERAEEHIAELGLSDRIRVRECDAAQVQVPEPVHLAMCVGSTHAFGGMITSLKYLRPHLRPDGLALVGDGFWEQRPHDAALTSLGSQPDEYDDLPTTVDKVIGSGWIPVYGHVSAQSEWDDYEWSWCGSLARWALDNREKPGAAEAASAAEAHREAWLRGYRGVLGFVTLLLRPTA